MSTPLIPITKVRLATKSNKVLKAYLNDNIIRKNGEEYREFPNHPIWRATPSYPRRIKTTPNERLITYGTFWNRRN